MHKIVTEHPAVVEVDRQLADHRRAEDAHRQRAAAATADYHERLAEWRGRHETAVLSGEEPPPQPDPPDDQRDAAHILLERRLTLVDQRRRTLAEIENDVTAAAQDREGQLLSAARELIEQLRPIVGELREVHDAVRAVRSAADAVAVERVVPTRASRMVPVVDVVAVVGVVERGGSLLDVVPIERQTGITSAPEPHRSAAEEQRLDRIMRDQRIAMARGRTL